MDKIWKAIRSLLLLTSLVSAVFMAMNRNTLMALTGLSVPTGNSPSADGQTAPPAAGPDTAKLASMIIAAAPDNAQAHMAAGALFLRQKKTDDAMLSFKKVVEINPENADAHFQIGMILMKHEKLSEAGKEFSEAIRIDPAHVNSRFGLGAVLQQTATLDEAAAQYKEILRLQPNNGEAHNNLGIVYDAQNRREMAAAEFKTALELMPNDPTIRQNLDELVADMKMFQAPAPVNTAPDTPMMTSAEPEQKPSPAPEIAGPDMLLLTNGRTVHGHILEKTDAGVWLEFGSGKVFFSNEEISSITPSK